MKTVGWLRLRPDAAMESGVVPPSPRAVEEEEEEEDGQEEEGQEEEDEEEADDVRSTAVELLLCGDSSLISIWFLRGPVEMFWMLYWLKEDEEEAPADGAGGRPEEAEEQEEEEEAPTAEAEGVEEEGATAEEEEEDAGEALEEAEACWMACRKEGA